MNETDGPPRAALIAALVLAVGAIVVVLAVAVSHRAPQQPVAISAVPAPHAGNPGCQALLAALPQQLGDYQRATVAAPAPAGAAAWGRPDRNGEPVVLRCGLERPADFVIGAALQVVDAVQWFAARTDGRTTWYTVDRPVYVALTLPQGSGPTPIQQLSDLIADTIAPVPINPAPE
jgi:hypothetical protein